jgi:hypothetical protein
MEQRKAVEECKQAISNWDNNLRCRPEDWVGFNKWLEAQIDAGEECRNCLEYLIKGERQNAQPNKETPEPSPTGAPQPTMAIDEMGP